MQQLAAAIIKDDGISDPVRALAALASGGSNWRNCARDYTRFLASRLKFPSLVLPYQIDIPIPKLEGLGTEVKPAFVMLPHEVFSTLYAEWPSQFHEICCTHKVSQFWEMERQHRAPPPRAAQTIPLRAWGDDASHCKTASFMAMSWCSCLAFNIPATFSRLVFGCLDLKQCDLPSFEKCYTVFVWSMEQLFRGIHPSHNHDGK